MVRWLGTDSGKSPLGEGQRMVPNAGCMAMYALLWNDPGQDRLMTSIVMPVMFLGKDSVHLDCLLKVKYLREIQS